MRTLFLIIIFLIVKPLLAQPEFYVQRCLPDWYYLTKVPNSNTFYASGAVGAIYKSTDNGATWHGLNSVLETTIYGIFFINEETGWAVTWTGKIEKTTNHGDTWTLISDQTNQSLTDVFFVNVNTGFAGGGPVLLKTTDGGFNWTTSYYDANTYIQRMYFPNESYGWIAGNAGQLFITTNGGQNWNFQSPSTLNNIMAIYFLNQQTGWIAGTSTNLNTKFAKVTTNSGVSWTGLPIGNAGGLWNSVQFFDLNNGYVSGYGVAKTSDGGQTWAYSSAGGGAVKFYDMNTGVAIGAYGHISRTTNGSISWTTIQGDPNAKLNGVSFVDQNTGWAVSVNGIALKTTTGGIIWTTIPGFGNTNLNCVNFKGNYGCIGGDDGTVYFTTNGGQNWTLSNNNSPGSNINSIVLVDSINVLGACSNGRVIKSQNGGSTWYTNLVTPAPLHHLYFINHDTGWVVGESGVIRRTNTSATSWGVQDIAGTYTGKSIYFIDPFNGWIVGGGVSGTIEKTTNGGINWSDQQIPSSFPLNDVHFFNTNSGFTIGDYGAMFYTTNSGANWLHLQAPLYASFTNMFFLDVNHGWLVGDYGTIVKVAQPIGIIQNGVEIPDKFELGQNFPNPFNPSTKINFSLPIPARVSVKIYDILGRMVKELVNEFRHAGNYTVTFDGIDLASGVYIYRIESGKFIDSKKMVIIK